MHDHPPEQQLINNHFLMLRVPGDQHARFLESNIAAALLLKQSFRHTEGLWHVTLHSLYSHETLLFHHLSCSGSFWRVACCMQDFMHCLPFPEYAHPGGSLNVANYLSQDLVKPDLGPKSYIATGRYHCSSPFLSHAPCCSPGMYCSPCTVCTTQGCFITWDLTHPAAAMLIPLRLVSVLLFLVIRQHDVCRRPQIWPKVLWASACASVWTNNASIACAACPSHAEKIVPAGMSPTIHVACTHLHTAHSSTWISAEAVAYGASPNSTTTYSVMRLKPQADSVLNQAEQS